jgi:hypothetical protein
MHKAVDYVAVSTQSLSLQRLVFLQGASPIW